MGVRESHCISETLLPPRTMTTEPELMASQCFIIARTSEPARTTGRRSAISWI
ncbi:hypothetical protein K443DRAFT_218231 [Laccaria amethystina LaAM-08-1]|uniref:Uncharacterized protein n=1 Tax=Laccaria amethystina LaAM-08-1 TaxID=1095629 RepID=A0A0C9XZQ9_9AGAR|nr:hypothetical protein K443DRAFT_218231 [Laccaria amethystina LaAM-08-1]